MSERLLEIYEKLILRRPMSAILAMILIAVVMAFWFAGAEAGRLFGLPHP